MEYQVKKSDMNIRKRKILYKIKKNLQVRVKAHRCEVFSHVTRNSLIDR